MDSTLAIDLILRWTHILSATILVGGTIFQRVAWLPGLTAEAHGETAAGVRSRWSKLVMASSGLLLLSGFINFILIVQRYEFDGSFPGSAYHALFGIKFLLALAVFFLSAVLAGRSGLAQRLRQKEALWLNVNMTLAIVIVCLAGMMKMAGRAEKSAESARPHPVLLAWHEPA